MKNFIHELKILPQYFNDILKEVKTFEVRKNDRNFQVGDILRLNEYIIDANKYTGRSINVRIVYKLSGGQYGIDKEYCILGIKIINFYNKENP